jgi:hypothetical protein
MTPARPDRSIHPTRRVMVDRFLKLGLASRVAGVKPLSLKNRSTMTRRRSR